MQRFHSLRKFAQIYVVSMGVVLVVMKILCILFKSLLFSHSQPSFPYRIKDMEISRESDAHVTCPNLFCIHEYIKYNFRANSYLVLDHSCGNICALEKFRSTILTKHFNRGRKQEIVIYTITLSNNAVYGLHAAILHYISQSQSNWTMPGYMEGMYIFSVEGFFICTEAVYICTESMIVFIEVIHFFTEKQRSYVEKLCY